MNNKIKKLSLLLGDVALLYLALYLTLLVRYWEWPSLEKWQSHFTPFTLAFLGWMLIFYISNLYSLHQAVNNAKFYQLTGRSITIAGLMTALLFYLDPSLGIAPKTNLIIFIAIFAAGFILWRLIFNWLVSSYMAKSQIAFIGYNGLVKELIGYLKVNPGLGYKAALLVKEPDSDGLSDIPVVNDIKNLKQAMIDKKISTAVLVSDPHQSHDLRTSLFDCLPLKINFISLPNFYESVTNKVPTDSINQMWFLENLNESNKSVFDSVKRAYDVFLALLIIGITFVFWPLIALAIKIESRGSAFFISKRMGKNNREFNLIKFRTMREEANDRAPTQSKDPRVTRFGNFLRRTRIDELPQMINILKGEMSFVGPRPERPELITELEKVIPFYHERFLVKPGLTGSDQISGEYHSPSREDTLKKLQYDLFYIKNRSIYLDLSIILKTIATVISRSGV